MRTVMTRMVFASALLLFSPGLVAAEPYAGLFVGAAITQDADVEDKLTPVTTFKDVGFDTSVVFGGKVGLFFDPPVLGGNFGLELEAYHFRPDIETQTVSLSANGFSGKFRDRKSTRLNSSHGYISYAVFCLKKKKNTI